jgi:hypothetical protein
VSKKTHTFKGWDESEQKLYKPTKHTRNIATFSRSVSGRLSVNEPNVAPEMVVTSPHSSDVGN